MAKLLFTIVFFVNELWDCEGRYLALFTVRVGGLMMQNIKTYNSSQARTYTDLKFTCNGTMTRWIMLTEGSVDYVSQGPQIQIWMTNSCSIPARSPERAPQNVSFRNGSILGLHQPDGSPISPLYVEGSSPHSYSNAPVHPCGASTIAPTTRWWEYPLVGAATDPPGCFSGLSTEDLWYIVNATRLLANICACTLHNFEVSCNLNQCSSITKFYIGAVFTPTFLQETVLQLKVIYRNGSSDVNLVISGTPNMHTFVFEFIPSHPLIATPPLFRLHLTDGNNQSVAFASHQDQPLIAVQSESNCCSSRHVHKTIMFFQTAYRNMQTEYPYDLFMCQHCLLLDMTFTFTGAIARWTFTANQSKTNATNINSYPHFELWRKASGTAGYTLLNSTAGMVPVEAGPPNVYEYRLKVHWSFQDGDALGLQLPPPDASQLNLIFILNNASLMYCHSDNFTLCSNLSIVPLVTPEVIQYTGSLARSTGGKSSLSSDGSLAHSTGGKSSLSSDGSLAHSTGGKSSLSSDGSLARSTSPKSTFTTSLANSTPFVSLSATAVTTFPTPLVSLLPISFTLTSSIITVLTPTSSISNPSSLTSSSPMPLTSSSIPTSSLPIFSNIPLSASISSTRRGSSVHGSTTMAPELPTGTVPYFLDNTLSSAHSPSHYTSLFVPARQNSTPLIGPIVGPALGAILVVGLAVCIVAFIVQRRRRRKRRMIGRYMAFLGENLALDNVLYNAVSHTQHEALEQSTCNNSYGNGLDVGKRVEYAVFTNSLATPYYQFPVQNDELYWEPSSTSEQLYEQFSQYQYNHILRSAVTVLEYLGSGEFGTVSKGLWSAPNRVTEVALKTLRLGAEEKDRVRFLREAAIMGQFHHPNVVQLHGVVTVGDPLMIVLELMSGGDLRQLLIDQKQRASSDPWLPHRCLQFCWQIASGMVYLAKKAFIHRDLAARNILVCNDGDVCKIADFGMSRDLQDDEYYRSNGGKIPVKWTAPEALHYKTYSHASDVWSFGCVMYEIWSLGRKPFEENSNQEVLELIDSGYRLPPPPGCPKAIYGLMMQCWNPEKASRPTFEAIFHSLSEPEDQVLQWAREDTQTHPQCSLLGVPLDCGKNLYPSLQGMYL